MNTTKEERDILQERLDDSFSDNPWKTIQVNYHLIQKFVDDSRELARLREGLNKDILDLQSESEITAERVARRLQFLLTQRPQ